MQVEPKTVTLKDNRTCVIRSPRVSDAAELIRYLKTCCGETDFLLRTPEECDMTVEQEEKFLENIIQSDSALMLIAEVEGEIAGNCDIRFMTRKRANHRAVVGIGLYRKFWNLGVGSALLNELLAAARAREGIIQVELEVIQGNERAMALYKKMGFQVVAEHPNAIRMSDGSLVSDYMMIHAL